VERELLTLPEHLRKGLESSVGTKMQSFAAVTISLLFFEIYKKSLKIPKG
jgi:hypothetical protein